jgi:hypothetical protein
MTAKKFLIKGLMQRGYGGFDSKFRNDERARERMHLNEIIVLKYLSLTIIE